MRFKYCCIGGTFDSFHIGHEQLINRAFSLSSRVRVGVTSDSYQKDHDVESFSDRRKKVLDFLKNKGWLSRAEVLEIDNGYTPAMEQALEAIIVSPETFEVAERINDMRAERGFKPLKIVKLPWVRARDGNIVSSTAIRKGIMDRNGKLR